MREENVGRIAGYQIDGGHVHYLVYRSLVAALQTAVAFAHGALLDIGCGNKPYERMFDGKVSSYTGCDLVQSDRQRVDILCPATDIPVQPSSFDTVLTTQVIEHVDDHRLLVAEAYRVLRPGGILILSAPMYWPLHEEPYDFFRFTKHGLRHLLQASGFEVLKIMANGGKWALAGQALIHAIESTRLHRRSIVTMLNKVFSWLDDRSLDETNTMNYVIVARKP